jgi:hypothetical protein
MSRELISSSSYPFSNSTPSSSMKASQSRIPVKAKRAPLGERVDNHDHTTPRQHLVKSVKSVIRPRIISTKSTASPSKSSTYRSSPRAAVQGSPSSSIVSSPTGANVSRPGHTPHPRRSSVGLAYLGHDVSMLMDTTRLDFVSDTDDSEGDEPTNNLLVRRGVMGPGRLMTPANSQESQVSSLAFGVLADIQPNSQQHTRKEPSPRRLAIRLPTPPASQSGTDVEETISRTLVRPRPAPTPPRRSAGPSILLNGMASPTQDISPNPRRKKSPRVDEAGPSQLRSPFEIATTTTSPRHPRDRVEIVIGQPSRKSVSPSATPKASKPRKSRVSTKTPASHPLSQSTSSQPSRAKRAPATAPQPNRRKSTPAARKTSPPRTTAKPKFAKTPKRLSLPGRGRARKSVTPAELKAMIGLLPEPVEQSSPSDDPLLLVSDDEDHTPAVRPSSHSGKSTGSRSAARIIDFDAAIQGRSSVEEVVRDYEVPIHGSEPDYDVARDYRFDSGDSDEEMGNDTFVNVAGARAKVGTSVNPADRQEEATLDDEEERLASSRSNSPFVSQEAEVRYSSPALSLRAASPAKEDSRFVSSPVSPVASPVPSVAASLPSPFLSRSTNSPRLNRSTTATPVVHYHGLPSPAPSSPPPMEMEPEVASSPHYARSQTVTPRATVAVDQEFESATVPASPAYSEKFSVGVPSAPSSPFSTRSRGNSATPRFTEQLSIHSQGMDEEEVQDSWNASPLLLPGTPSALGLFMPEEADGMSTPYPHVEYEHDTPAPMLGSPSRSTASAVHSPAPAVEALASPTLFGTRVASPARSVSQVESPARSLASQVGSPTRSLALQVASPARSTTSHAAELPMDYTQSPRRFPVCLPQEMELPEEIPTVSTSSPRRSPVCLPSRVDVVDNVEEQPLPVVHTHSPRRSPLASTQSPRRSPVCLPADMENDDEDEAGDKENMALVQSTTPILSPPTLKSTPPMYAFTFSPRIASPLRIAHNQASTLKRDCIARTSQSPIPAAESFHERFAEVDESPSADITLEGNSADWSLSDEGLPEMDREEHGLGLDLQGEGQESNDNLSGSSSIAEEGGEEEDDLVDSSIEQEDDLELGAGPTSQVADDIVDSNEDEQDAEEDAEGSEEEEGQESNVIAPIPTFTDGLPPAEGKSTDSEEAPSSDEQQEDETAQEELEEDIPASPAPVKIVLKLINRGIVKIEPPTSPVRATNHADSPLGPASEVRSTTPAYDPPQPIVAAPATASPAPAATTLYPALPTTPTTAPISPLVSTTPLGTPPARQRSPAPRQSLHQSFDYNTLQAGPSTRPRSRLSRQVPDSPEQEESDSIRVRAPRSLGLELEDADANNSMRSVVEVSSLDPKAAARAAAILKLVSFLTLCTAKLTCRTTHISNMVIFRNLARQLLPAINQCIRLDSTSSMRPVAKTRLNFFTKPSWRSSRLAEVDLGQCLGSEESARHPLNYHYQAHGMVHLNENDLLSYKLKLLKPVRRGEYLNGRNLKRSLGPRGRFG